MSCLYEQTITVAWMILCLSGWSAVRGFSITRETGHFHKRTDTHHVHHIEEPPGATTINCIDMISQSGTYMYQSQGGDTRVCALYMVGQPDQLVQINFHHFDVDCADDELNNIIELLDGWQVQNMVFPSSVDYTGDASKRQLSWCGDRRPVEVFLSSQNVAVLKFLLPSRGQAFRIQVDFVDNPQPCNVVSMQASGYMTLKNYGRRSNCSLSLIYPEHVRILAIDVGETVHEHHTSSTSQTGETGVQYQCDLERRDYVELYDGNDLDPMYMWREGAICGMDSSPDIDDFKLLCKNSVIRLVSSGDYYNTVTIEFNELAPLTPEQSLELQCDGLIAVSELDLDNLDELEMEEVAEHVLAEDVLAEDI